MPPFFWNLTAFIKKNPALYWPFGLFLYFKCILFQPIGAKLTSWILFRSIGIKLTSWIFPSAYLNWRPNGSRPMIKKQHSDLGRGSNNQNGNLRWHLPWRGGGHNGRKSLILAPQEIPDISGYQWGFGCQFVKAYNNENPVTNQKIL